MPSSVTLSECGIIVYNRGKKILLDPKRLVPSDYIFVSHAHIDHLHRKSSDCMVGKILASKATSLIANARGYAINNVHEECDGFQLIDTGHILGSKGLLMDLDLYYTGDISIRERAFMKPAALPKVHTLIIESTFGNPKYIFPSIDDVIHKTNKIISEMYDKGIPVILMGYPLGKAQLLTEFFGHWDPVYIHDAIHKMNFVYKELGIPLKSAVKFSTAERQGLLAKKPWVMISPLTHGRSDFITNMKEKYDAITIGFSGWAIDTRHKFMMGLDHMMPFSDHCDYRELVDVVKKCNPKKIITFHGFSVDFAKVLRRLGFDAESINDITLRDKRKPLSDNTLDKYISKVG